MSEALEPGTSRATLDDMATAWWRVAITLDELDPGWSEGRLVNADAACATIRDLAGEKALREIEAAEVDPFADVRDKRMSELTDEQKDRALELWSRQQKGWFSSEQAQRMDALFRVIDRLRATSPNLSTNQEQST